MIQVLIRLSESAYKEMCENGVERVDYDIRQMMREGTPLPKGHGRLIDADAFIDGLRDSSKRQRYNECFIDEHLTVDDVFQAVIESLENEGLAEGDAPTIIEADEEGAEE